MSAPVTGIKKDVLSGGGGGKVGGVVAVTVTCPGSVGVGETSPG